MFHLITSEEALYISKDSINSLNPSIELQHSLSHYTAGYQNISSSLVSICRPTSLVKVICPTRGNPNTRTPGVLVTYKLPNFLVLAKLTPNWTSLHCQHILGHKCIEGGILLDQRPCQTPEIQHPIQVETLYSNISHSKMKKERNQKLRKSNT